MRHYFQILHLLINCMLHQHTAEKPDLLVPTSIYIWHVHNIILIVLCVTCTCKCFFSFTRWNCCLSTWLKVLRSVFTDLDEGSLSLYWTPNMYKTYHAIRRIVPLDWWFISNEKKIPHHKRQCCSQINILIINTLTTHIVATKRCKSLPRLPLLI